MATARTILVIMLAPTAVAVGVLWLSRAAQAVQRLLRASRNDLLPAGPPLERIAADLRRLLAEHERVRRTPGLAVRARRLVALEGAITDSALAAARAVGLDPPARHGREPLPPAELRALLGDLARSGLVLPSHERFGR